MLYWIFDLDYTLYNLDKKEEFNYDKLVINKNIQELFKQDTTNEMIQLFYSVIDNILKLSYILPQNLSSYSEYIGVYQVKL